MGLQVYLGERRGRVTSDILKNKGDEGETGQEDVETFGAWHTEVRRLW